MSVTIVQIFIEKYVHLEGNKITFRKSYNKINLTLVVISDEIYSNKPNDNLRSTMYKWNFFLYFLKYYNF